MAAEFGDESLERKRLTDEITALSDKSEKLVHEIDTALQNTQTKISGILRDRKDSIEIQLALKSPLTTLDGIRTQFTRSSGYHRQLTKTLLGKDLTAADTRGGVLKAKAYNAKLTVPKGSTKPRSGSNADTDSPSPAEGRSRAASADEGRSRTASTEHGAAIQGTASLSIAALKTELSNYQELSGYLEGYLREIKHIHDVVLEDIKASKKDEKAAEETVLSMVHKRKESLEAQVAISRETGNIIAAVTSQLQALRDLIQSIFEEHKQSAEITTALQPFNAALVSFTAKLGRGNGFHEELLKALEAETAKTVKIGTFFGGAKPGKDKEHPDADAALKDPGFEAAKQAALHVLDQQRQYQELNDALKGYSQEIGKLIASAELLQKAQRVTGALSGDHHAPAEPEHAPSALIHSAQPKVVNAPAGQVVTHSNAPAKKGK